MKIALFSSKKSSISITSLVSTLLGLQIKDVEIKEIIADNNLDLVKEISSLEGFDLTIVILHYENDSSDVKILMEKLVEFELAGKPTLKFIEKGSVFDDEEEAEKISNSVLEKHFGKKPVPVEEDDFSLL